MKINLKSYEESDEEDFLGFKPFDVEAARNRGMIRVRRRSELIKKNILSADRKFRIIRRKLLRGECWMENCNHNLNYSPMVVYESS